MGGVDAREVANQLWQMADDADTGSDQWWTLSMAAEMLGGARWVLAVDGEGDRYTLTEAGKAALEGE